MELWITPSSHLRLRTGIKSGNAWGWWDRYVNRIKWEEAIRNAASSRAEWIDSRSAHTIWVVSSVHIGKGDESDLLLSSDANKNIQNGRCPIFYWGMKNITPGQKGVGRERVLALARGSIGILFPCNMRNV